MQSSNNIRHTAAIYLKQSLWIFVALFLVGLVVVNVWMVDKLVEPLIWSVVYALVVETLDAVIWRKVAATAEDSLPTFFMGATMVRFFSALVVLVVYRFAIDPADMLPFLVVFGVFYLALLIHHVTFFVKGNHSSTAKIETPHNDEKPHVITDNRTND